MHIADGVLPTPVTIGSYLATTLVVGLSLKRLRQEDYPKVALMSSSFFIASLIHVPLGPTSVHLLLPGIVGVILGRLSFIAITLGTVLQCFLFQFGGITAIGANCLMMGIPALFAGWIFGYFSKKSYIYAVAGGGIAGGVGVISAALILAGFLFLSGENFFNIAKLALVAHVPIVIIESVISAFMVGFLYKVKPELILHGS